MTDLGTYVTDDADGLVAPSLRDTVIVLRAVRIVNVPPGRVQQATLKVAQARDVGPSGAAEPAYAKKEYVRSVLDFGLGLFATGAPHAQTPYARVLVPRRMCQLVAEAYVVHQFVFVDDAPQVREDLCATGVDFGPFRLPRVFKFLCVGNI
jgi:hypothetical protein